ICTGSAMACAASAMCPATAVPPSPGARPLSTKPYTAGYKGDRMLARRRFLGAAGLGLVAGALPFAARAQGFETARILVGFPPGGTTDIMARKVADMLRAPSARAVIVENRPGAAGQRRVVV